VTIISVPSESNSSHNDFISSCAPTPSSFGWSGLSGRTALVVVVDSPGVVFPSWPVVSAARSTSAGTAGDGVLERCCLSAQLDDVSTLVRTSSRPPATPSDDDVKQSDDAALDKYAATTTTTRNGVNQRQKLEAPTSTFRARRQNRQLVCNSKAPFTRYSLLSNRLYNWFDNRVNVCIHDTTGCQTLCQTSCQTRLTTGLTTGCIV